MQSASPRAAAIMRVLEFTVLSLPKVRRPPAQVSTVYVRRRWNIGRMHIGVHRLPDGRGAAVSLPRSPSRGATVPYATSRVLLLTSMLASAALPQAPLSSAPVRDVRYEVTFDRQRALRRTLHVTTRFRTDGNSPVLLSLPAWTPGAYELSYFARHVSAFSALGDDKPIDWDKVDFDTWRLQPAGATRITVSFDFRADALDNAMAWARDDFAFFNGTNLFLYPEGRDLAFGSQVEVVTEADWKVASAMPVVAGTTGDRSRHATDYHELVDMPFFVGAFDLDSARVGGLWMRLATYPSRRLAGPARDNLWQQLRAMMPPMVEVFGQLPIRDYTTLMVFDTSSAGGSALEHGNSHVGIYSPFVIGSSLLPLITAHEIFHLWNVKRMRPAEMVPYRYDRAQPTALLWVSEGLTDYYADLTLLRAGIVDTAEFLEMTQAKIDEVDGVPPVALEDASLSTWVQPGDGTAYLYYPKGSLAGLLLDIQIRDASDNAASLDDVMRDVYQRTFEARRAGFTEADWWAAVTRAARGKPFAAFVDRYIDGREPFPYDEVLALGGLRFRVDSIHEPRIGVFTAADSAGVMVTAVDSGSAAAEAGVRPGDVLISVGGISVTEGFGERFRARYARSEGQLIDVVVRREARDVTLKMRLRIAVRTERHLIADRGAPQKAVRIRRGIFTGRRG
jgi:predicted metalloprotease with PDZ domain